LATISVIIPTLNAAPHLARALAPLVAGAAGGLVKQVIVADGGSNDQTVEIAEAAGCDIVVGRAGRGKQMRLGAAAAKGGWLLFLHADTALDPGWDAEAERFIASPRARMRAAAFRLGFDDTSRPARRIVFWARLRAKWLKLPYGDQGLLIARNFYEALGGHSDLPLMEDLEFVRRIGAKRIVLLETLAVTSAEKYRRDGYNKRAWRNFLLTTRYLLGADPVELAKAYD
jgi:rSAM/selenodomain-associated transferase 2